MKKLFTFLSLLFVAAIGYGQIISQYIETNSGSTPKGIEIWNNTGSTLDFSTNNLVIKKGTNGGSLSAVYTLSSGTLADGAVIVIGTSDLETVTINNGSSFYDKSFSFNGDDALQVEYGGVVTDVFGEPGSDPGSAWSGNGVSTKNQNIELKSSITTGDTDGWTDPSTRFNTNNTDPAGTGGDDGFGIAPSSGSSNSTASDIITTTGWSEPTNIDYTSYSATSSLTTANSIEVASFTIRDGGTTTDADAVGTELTALSVDVSNYFDLEALAVFDGTSNVAEVTSIAGGASGTVSFSGLSLSATDGGTKDFTLRATFGAGVTDNDNIKYAISSATASSSGSDFAAADAGAAATDDTGDNNKIVVTADRFEFMGGQTSVTVGQDFMVDINAVDVNGNADMDANPSVSISRGSTGTGSLSSATGLTQTMSGGFIEYTDVQYDAIGDFTIDVSATGYTTTTSGTYTASGNYESNIIIASTFTEPTNIDYSTYNVSSSLSTSNSIEIAKFTIQDGGDDNIDDDNLTTKLTDLDITVDKWENIKTLAIFEGSTNKGEVSVGSGSVSFSSITGGIEATDDGTKDFSIYATFNSTVTDNDNIQITIATPTAASSGSTFDVGAVSANTDNTGDNNKIVVTATKLAFTANKPGSSVDKNTDFTVEVKALDANDNIDVDASDPVTISEGSGTGSLSSATGLTNQTFVLGVYTWTDVQYDTEEDFTITASAGALTSATTGTITCSTPTPIPDLIISEVADPKDVYKARFVELYNGSGAAIDFSTDTFYLSRQANGGNFADVLLTGSVAKDAMYVVAYSSSDFQSAYGFSEDLYNGYISGNGDDGYFLYYGGDHATGTLVDQYGVLDEDGTGKSWEYTDSRAVRESSTVKSGSKAAHTFDVGDWAITNDSNTDDMTPGTKDGNQTLPVKLLTFLAENTQGVIVLKWQTASEENSAYFSLERSNNAKDFEEIAQLRAAGNSNKVQNYKYIDQSADLKQSIYYRLKQIDYNGDYTYSDIVSVNALAQNIKLNKCYSTDEQLNMEINSNINTYSQLQLIDITGKILYSRELNINRGLHNYRIGIGNFSRGVYFLRITTESGINMREKLIL